MLQLRGDPGGDTAGSASGRLPLLRGSARRIAFRAGAAPTAPQRPGYPMPPAAMARSQAQRVGGLSIGSRMPVSQLATLSMKQTPESMAKVTGVQAERSPTGEIEMCVPLSGGVWGSINVIFGRRLDKNGSY